MIALVGFMGAGKTTVGRILAGKLGLPFLDTDAMVVASTGTEIHEIFETRGEPGFRELEREAAYEALSGDDAVVSLGGGALTDPGIVAQLQRVDVVHLDVAYGEAMKRIGGDEGRPMLKSNARVLFKDRGQVYRTVAKITVDTNGRDPGDLAVELARHFGVAGDDDTSRIRVRLADRSYDVIVGIGIAGRIAGFLPELPGAEKAFVVTHEVLRPYAQEMLSSLSGTGLDVEVLTVPDGEACKSLEVVTALYEDLAGRQAHRRDAVVVFGGGAVSDCAGYVASTYARGMPVVNVPTTLLAQVDASIGGKTAVNLRSGKNLVGTIHQPSLVLSDVGLLSTCPREELRAGTAEVVKYGFISDPTLLDFVTSNVDAILSADPSITADVVARCAAIKAHIVSIDERERKQRAYLNYGHTFAHAIEKLKGFSGIRHGEAVAVGMMAAAYLAHELGCIDESVVETHQRVLTAVGLPVTASLVLGELEESWRLDKKYEKGVRFVLLRGLGRPEAGIEAPRAALLRSLERLRSAG